MDGLLIAFVAPVILFVCIVAPIWIFMHYKSKQKAQGALSEQERADLELLILQAEKMTERIETLEAILDDETPGWRKRISTHS